MTGGEAYGFCSDISLPAFIHNKSDVPSIYLTMPVRLMDVALKFRF